MQSAVLYRRPNVAAVDRAVQEMRAVTMGEMIPSSLDAPVRLADALQRGVHVGMLVDQHFTKGVDVTFFGRPAKANPLLARLARQVECPIHGTRIVRLPGGRFRAEITDEVEPVRDASGAVDVQGTTQRITAIIEDWIREYPDQWLWLHRRWR
jgi:KDO2-lipid IV(A) lauroyltransferase